MALLQVLLALISRSAGKVLNAIFGWAVRALFGQTTANQQTMLSAVVAAAVAWPLLLVGMIAPRVSALALAFVPIPKWVPSYAIRLVWIGLAVLVPIVVGLAVAAKAPARSAPESFLKRTLRGFPITLGLASAFLIMFVSVPILRLVSAVRGRKDCSIPLMTDAAAYRQVAELIVKVLNARGFDLVAATPGWWVSAPTRILLRLGGKAFRGYVPEHLAHYTGPGIEVSLYPSGAILRGKPEKTAWAYGLIAEAVVHSDGFQTTEPRAHAIEKQIRRVWKVLDENPKAHESSRMLLMRLDEIAKEIGELHIDYDEWQILYRQALQLDRALHGEPQLLEDKTPREASMSDKPKSEDSHISSPAGLPLGQLVGEIGGQVSLLVKKQIELAKTELKADLKSEVAMVGGLGIAALAAIATVNLLLVTVILALAGTMPAWTAGLLVSGFTLLVAMVAALMGWNKRVRTPLATTRETLREDIQWTKERLA